MVNKIPSQLNLLRQRKRSAIQLYIKENPDAKLNKVAEIFHVSPMTGAKWKKKIILLIQKELEKQR